jgi:hypothetical protein
VQGISSIIGDSSPWVISLMIPQTIGYFQITQYRIHRSKDVARVTFLQDPKALEAGIIAAQEPWDNPFEDTIHHPTKSPHQLLYPHEADTGKGTRVCCLIFIDDSRPPVGTTKPTHETISILDVRLFFIGPYRDLA